MKFTKLIADSGGTKTDWFGVDDQGDHHRFTTESYHPLQVDEAFINRQLEFWKQHTISDCILHFYGAGCLQEEKQEKMKAVFRKIGFADAFVESDLFAAAKAVNNENGMIAICGTGSVLFKVEHEQLVELRGGLGWDQGDEGGGFYFGKLLLQRLEDHPGDYPEIRNVIEKWKNMEELVSVKGKPESKSEYARLAALFSGHLSHPLIAGVHMENIQLFLQLYAGGCPSIGFVGSYAFYLQDYFRLACQMRGIEVTGFIERPIELLAKDFLF